MDEFDDTEEMYCQNCGCVSCSEVRAEEAARVAAAKYIQEEQRRRMAQDSRTRKRIWSKELSGKKLSKLDEQYLSRNPLFADTLEMAKDVAGKPEMEVDSRHQGM